MIINLTPHAIRIRIDESNEAVELDSDIVIQPSGNVARVSSKSEQIGDVDGVPMFRTTFGEVVGLPESQDGTLYLVSGLVAAAVKNRGDLVGPKSGPDAIRKDGQIFAVRGVQVL